MFDIGWSELLVIGVVALIVVGPKDLPGMFRTLGRFTGKMRRMAREFQRAMEDAADDSGLGEVSRDLKGMTNPKKMGLDKLNEAADRFEKWDPSKPSSKATAKAPAKTAGDPVDKAKSKAREIGPETAKLSEERKAQADRIREYSAAKGAEKRAAEAAASAQASGGDTGEPQPEEKADDAK